MTAVIYEPRGPAREYAELACNLYAGCTHGCRYCYVPALLRKRPADFHAGARPRPGVLEALEREAPAYAGDPREVLLSFTSDPYQPSEEEHHLTRRALEILIGHGVRVCVLTKDPQRAMQFDGELLLRGRVRLGATVTGFTDKHAQSWEPGAPGLTSRQAGMREARRAGLRTWLSLEPVIDPLEALWVIRIYADIADEIRIGKINHHPELERAVDWSKFVTDATALCREQGVRFMLKQSLARYL